MFRLGLLLVCAMAQAQYIPKKQLSAEEKLGATAEHDCTLTMTVDRGVSHITDERLPRSGTAATAPRCGHPPRPSGLPPLTPIQVRLEHICRDVQIQVLTSVEM